MTTIVIKDLPENIELDRQAMSAITGGARISGHPSVRNRTRFRGTGILGYPGIAVAQQPSMAYAQSVIGKAQK
jgi:hypothetical protein